MFTGLIEQTATVISNKKVNEGQILILDAKIDTPILGESIAINGVCLTLAAIKQSGLCFSLSKETLSLSNLAYLEKGSLVNIERALAVNARFGGHYVSGHVDTCATVLGLEKLGEYTRLSLGGFTSASYPYLLPKASICLEGVSLTINKAVKGCIDLMLIPYTLAHSSLASLVCGQLLNVEFDYIVRIVAHQFAILQSLQEEIK